MLRSHVLASIAVDAWRASGFPLDAWRDLHAHLARTHGVLILADTTFYRHRERLGEWCMKQRLPSIWGGAGYLADKYLNTSYLTLVGFLLGMGGALYLIWLMFGRE